MTRDTTNEHVLHLRQAAWTPFERRQERVILAASGKGCRRCHAGAVWSWSWSTNRGTRAMSPAPAGAGVAEGGQRLRTGRRPRRRLSFVTLIVGGRRLDWILALLLAGVVIWQVRPWIRVAWVSPERLESWLTAQEVMVLADIRPSEEFRAAHIGTAISVPRARIPQMSRVWTPDQRIVLVCRSAYREIHIYHQLRRRGFEHVYCLSGGMVAWARFRLRTAGNGTHAV